MSPEYDIQYDMTAMLKLATQSPKRAPNPTRGGKAKGEMMWVRNGYNMYDCVANGTKDKCDYMLG